MTPVEYDDAILRLQNIAATIKSGDSKSLVRKRFLEATPDAAEALLTFAIETLIDHARD